MAKLPKLASITLPDAVSTNRWEPPSIFIPGVPFSTALLTVPVSVASLVTSYQRITDDLVVASAVCARIGDENGHRARTTNAPRNVNRHFIVFSIWVSFGPTGRT